MSVETRQTSTTDPESGVAALLTYAELLNSQELARLYTYILRNGPIDIETIKDDLDLPHSTTYKYVSTLEEMDLLTRHDDETPMTVSVDSIHLTLETPEGEVLVTPALIDAVGRQRDSQDIRVFVDRQGIAKLAAALHYTCRVRNAELTQRMAANKLGVHPVEGITVITALQDVIEAANDDDPVMKSSE